MIAYSQCWEDASVAIKALEIDEYDIVLSITSGGCNTLAIAGKNPSLIYSVDSNYEQNFLLELKLAAIQNLSRDKTLAFLGYRNCGIRSEIFNNLVPFLSEECRQYWISNNAFIEKGIVHCGKFEKYLHVFRRFILPMVHGKKTLGDLVKLKSKDEQERFYLEKWDSLSWRLLFKIFFSRRVMSGWGRIKQMFTHSKRKSIASEYFSRVKHAFMNGVVCRNFYLNYILFWEFDELPLYLENHGVNTKISIDCIKIFNKDIFSFLKSIPDNSITKFNLSDIFEPLSQVEMNMIINEIYRVSKPDARLIFWNNLVYRNISEDKFNWFIRDINLESELVKHDKVFFYERFYIYRVTK